MALKDTWTDKANGVDDVVAEDINAIASSVIALENSSGGGTYIPVSDVMEFDWYRAFADALQSGTYLPNADVNNGELLLNFDQYICSAPDGSGDYVRKTKLYFTLKYVGQGTHSVVLSINYKGKLYITESYSELQVDNSYKFIFSRPYISFYLPE